jgi:predicted SprT family Zn-dependent metalloprotease
MALQVTKIIWVTKLANQLLEQHGLKDLGWQFELNQTAKRRVGQCSHRTKTISYSLYYLEKSTDEDIKDTILHEIAHALVDPQHGHDSTWRIKCMEIGAKPQRLAGEDAVTSATYNYEIYCTNCGKTTGKRYRLRQEMLDNYISKCCNAPLDAERI